jgi:hypothetical protein
MRTTLALDDELVAEAEFYTGVRENRLSSAKRSRR